MKASILMLLLFCRMGPALAFVSYMDKVDYGEDNQIEAYQASPALGRMARSTAVMVFSDSLRRSALGGFDLAPISLKVMDNLCSGERFAEQPAPGFCSGFLVGPDLLVTAGHCVDGLATSCASSTWVFDFAMDPQTGKAGQGIAAKNIYNCKKIIRHAVDWDGDDPLDFALIQLDRVVTDRAPLKVREEGVVPDNASLTMMGYPSGLPLKVALHGKIRANTDPVIFTGAIDSFHGSSGSPVVNATTLEVEGILSSGEDDYVWDAHRGCNVVKVCGENECRGEDAVRITNILELRERSKVLAAAESGDLATLEEYLKAGGWPELYDNQRVSLLEKANRAGQFAAASLISHYQMNPVELRSYAQPSSVRRIGGQLKHRRILELLQETH